MKNEKFEAHYEHLDDVAYRFERLSENLSELRHRLDRHAQDLESDGWKGEGVYAFFDEFQNRVLVPLNRLSDSLQSSSDTTRLILNRLSEAEHEAAMQVMHPDRNLKP